MKKPKSYAFIFYGTYSVEDDGCYGKFHFWPEPGENPPSEEKDKKEESSNEKVALRKKAPSAVKRSPKKPPLSKQRKRQTPHAEHGKVRPN